MVESSISAIVDIVCYLKETIDFMVEVIVLNVTCVVFIDVNIYADDVVIFVNLSPVAHCWNVPFSNACIWVFLC